MYRKVRDSNLSIKPFNSQTTHMHNVLLHSVKIKRKMCFLYKQNFKYTLIDFSDYSPSRYFIHIVLKAVQRESLC